MPRFTTRRRPERYTFGGRLAQVAEMLGQPFMPWQREAADIGCEIDPTTGLPAYNEVFVTVPRQSGKTLLYLTWQIDRCLSWDRPQRSAFTAQTGKDARDKWLDELFPLIEGSDLAPLVAAGGINRGMGNEAIHWKTGSLIRILSTSTASGHSKTLDQAVMDEVWHDVDDRREQGLRPAMITREDAQLLVCSTAGTAASTVYNRKVAAGRRAVGEDAGHGMAYIEYSAPDEWEPEDRDSWWSFMPALGHTVTPTRIEQERLAMSAGEFKRAYGNHPTAVIDSVIPADQWERVCSPTAKPEGELRFGVDVAEDRSSAAITAAGSNGVIELIEHKAGIGWVADRCNELTRAHGVQVALDAGGPAGVLIGSLERADPLGNRDVLHLCGAVYDAIVEGQIVFRRDRSLDAAVAGAVKKPVGDLWAWSRKGSVADVTPLMAATLSFQGKVVEREPMVAWA